MGECGLCNPMRRLLRDLDVVVACVVGTVPARARWSSTLVGWLLRPMAIQVVGIGRGTGRWGDNRSKSVSNIRNSCTVAMMQEYNNSQLISIAS